jgi:hypothetical protein
LIAGALSTVVLYAAMRAIAERKYLTVAAALDFAPCFMIASYRRLGPTEAKTSCDDPGDDGDGREHVDDSGERHEFFHENLHARKMLTWVW